MPYPGPACKFSTTAVTSPSFNQKHQYSCDDQGQKLEESRSIIDAENGLQVDYSITHTNDNGIITKINNNLLIYSSLVNLVYLLTLSDLFRMTTN